MRAHTWWWKMGMGILVLVASPLVGAQGNSQGPRPSIRVKTIAASAKQLVATADRAFVGTVAEAVVTREKLKDVDKPVELLKVNFILEEILLDKTGRLAPGQTLVLRLLAEASRPVTKGQKLLWYVAPDTEDGLTQPVGIDSGHFRFTPDGKSVINLKGNQNLLDPQIMSAQAEALVQEVPEVRRGEFRLLLQSWTETTAVGTTGKPVPLDLLAARTRQLAHENPQP